MGVDLIALVPLYDRQDFGHVAIGERFTVNDPQVARELLNAGKVRKPSTVSTIIYETKVIRAAPEVAATLPFRQRDLPNEKPADLAAQCDQVFRAADVSGQPPRTADSRGRRVSAARNASA